jgi:hypothetical protein
LMLQLFRAPGLNRLEAHACECSGCRPFLEGLMRCYFAKAMFYKIGHQYLLRSPINAADHLPDAPE